MLLQTYLNSCNLIIMSANNFDRNVVFFDGLCGLCNGFIDFVMKFDSRKSFYFSPLQSEYARNTLPAELTQDLKTVVAFIDGKTYKKSEAVFKVLQKLGGMWSFISLLRILPSSLSNFGYDLVAANRYSLFGKKETCRLPTPEERLRFLL